MTGSQAGKRDGRIRILFYNHTGHTSGAERVLLTTLKGLDRSCYEAVAACPVEGDLTTLLAAQGVRTEPVGALVARFTTSPRLLWQYLQSFAAVLSGFRATVVRVAPDVLHANSVRAGLVASVATIGTKIPIVWHVHDDLPRHPISSLIRLVAAASRRSRFVAVSQATATAFRGRLPFGDRVLILYNGIDLARYPVKTTTASSFRKELGLTQEDFLVAAVGMINPRKGLAGLLDAFKTVYERLPKAHLAIVGAPIFNRDDLHLAALQEQARRLGIDSRVHFTGPRRDVPAILRASDLLVLNALAEPFGLVLVEAMSSGTPVLATRVGGVPEIVTDGETGFLVSSSDSPSLARRMLEIFCDPAARRRVAAAALERVCPRFSEEHYSAGFASFLHSHYGHLKPVPATALLAAPFLAARGPYLLRGTAINGTTNGTIAGTATGAIAGTPASDAAPKARVAVFHDSFAQYGGAERVAEALHRTLKKIYPNTALLSTLTAEERLSPYLRRARILCTWMQRLPLRAQLFRAYFLLYPFAIDRVDLSSYDLIVSSCFGYAKGVRRRPGALHICYCHTPMRWVWRTGDYLSRERNTRIKAVLLGAPLRWLKAWELRAARRPDLYIANSAVVAARLLHAFGIHAKVIPPPIDTSRFAPPVGSAIGPISPPEDFYLVLSRLVPYKRFDLAVEACTRTGRRLIVVGDGPDRARLEAMAGPTVRFVGRAPDAVVNDYARRCRALLFPGEEDFGITPLEVNAAGRPVVAFRAGGAVETVIDGVTGTFFDEPTADALIGAIDELESRAWDAAAIRRHALSYDVTVFERRIYEFLEQTVAPRSPADIAAETSAEIEAQTLARTQAKVLMNA